VRCAFVQATENKVYDFDCRRQRRKSDDVCTGVYYCRFCIVVIVFAVAAAAGRAALEASTTVGSTPKRGI